MNAKKTLHKLRGESDKSTSSIYVSRTILDEFKEACGPIGHSRVMEELMREFVDDMAVREKSSILKKASSKKN